MRSKNMTKYFLVVLLFTEGAQVGHPPERFEVGPFATQAQCEHAREPWVWLPLGFRGRHTAQCAWAGRGGGDNGAPCRTTYQRAAQISLVVAVPGLGASEEPRPTRTTNAPLGGGSRRRWC